MENELHLAQDITQEDMKVFLDEAEEHLQALDEEVLQLERGGTSAEGLQRLFRAAHTIKGSSGMLGYQPMARVAHALESILDRLRKGTLAVDRPVVDALLQGLDAMRAMKQALVTPVPIGHLLEQTLPKLEHVAALQQATGQHSATPEARLELNDDARKAAFQGAAMGKRAFHIHVSLTKGTAWAAVRCLQLLMEASSLGEVLLSVPDREAVEKEQAGDALEIALLTGRPPEEVKGQLEGIPDVEAVAVEVLQLAAQEGESTPHPSSDEPAPSAANPTSRRAAESQTVRVDVERLDRLMDAVGELVLHRNRVTQISRQLVTSKREDPVVQQLEEASVHISKAVNDLREEVMRVRMLPVGTVFGGLPRMVRDLAQKMEKKVDFVVSGAETEIDRTVIERLRDPLIHLLRNAIDHGIELPDVRRAAGKPEAGTIHLSAQHAEGYMVITVTDDGRGIDREAVKASAVAKNLISQEVASRCTPAEALNLIFMAGSSTAKQLTDVSGRGVGMDIVKTNVEAMNGFVDVKTEVGKGTTFSLRLPLTLATLQGLLVTLGQQVYAIPLLYVSEILPLNRGRIAAVMDREAILSRGQAIPLVRLRQALVTAEADAEKQEEQCVIVVRVGDRSVGLAVNSVMEPQEIVVKSLGKYMASVKEMVGASVLGDGRVALIPDVARLVRDAA